MINVPNFRVKFPAPERQHDYYKNALAEKLSAKTIWVQNYNYWITKVVWFWGASKHIAEDLERLFFLYTPEVKPKRSSKLSLASLAARRWRKLSTLS